jgi:hypothetical protein|tara:strand:- start:1286 stop:1870 length:585 start_codon:yes stop_codon:yes gene_type:complete
MSKEKMENLWEQDQSDTLQEGGGDLAELNKKVKKLEACESRLEKLMEEVDTLKSNIKKISYEEIPDLLAEKGLASLKLSDGTVVEVKKVINAYLPKADRDPEGREKAFQWLRDNGHGDIIKNDITVSFGRGEDNKAVEYASLAQQKGYLPTQKVDVHNRVLVAAFRERLEKGQEVPPELFNLFVGNQTKIKRSK